MKQTYSLYPFIRTDKPNKQGLCYMYYRYTYKREYKLLSLKKSIKKEDWSSDKLEPKRTCPNRVDLITSLRDTRLQIEKIILNYEHQFGDYPQPAELLDLFNGNKIENLAETWDGLFDKFIEIQKQTKNVEKSTIDIYNQTKVSIKEYLKDRKIIWTWENVGLTLYNDFVSYHYSKKKSGNTIGKYIKTMKTYFRYVSDYHGLLTYNQFSKFVTIREENDFVTLTNKDIEIMKSSVGLSTLFSIDVELDEKEKEIMKFMILLTKTGMNFGDLMELNVFDFYNEEGIGDLFEDFVASKHDEERYIHIKKRRKKLKKIDKKQIPIIPVTHEISDILKSCFTRSDVFFLSLDNDEYNMKRFNQKEIHSINNLWYMIEDVKKMNEEDKRKQLPHYPNLFSKMHNSAFNEKIKILLEKIGLNYDVKLVNNAGHNGVEELIVPKHTMVSTRTGRRTLITSSISKGLNNTILKRMVGIKKDDTLNRYANLSEQVIVTEVKNKNPKPIRNSKK